MKRLSTLLAALALVLSGCPGAPEADKPPEGVKASEIMLDSYASIAVVEFEGYRYTIYSNGYRGGAALLRTERIEE